MDYSYESTVCKRHFGSAEGALYMVGIAPKSVPTGLTQSFSCRNSLTANVNRCKYVLIHHA